MNGGTKTIFALLPAFASFILAIFLDKYPADLGVVIVWLIIGLLVTGGIISAIYICGAIKRKNPNANMILLGLLFVFVVAVYLVTFFFGGCLLVISTGMIS